MGVLGPPLVSYSAKIPVTQDWKDWTTAEPGIYYAVSASLGELVLILGPKGLVACACLEYYGRSPTKTSGASIAMSIMRS